ncbi:MAG: hypothetical protein HYW08_07710 [candidate division NC10 bacterium]|nr:hypothetical protein [candidate division NC10 bacterium]
MTTRRRLFEELRRVAEGMIQGSFSVATRTCGTPGCGCHTDRAKRHGPHTYLTFKGPKGRTTSRYVPQHAVEEARRAVAAWERFWELAVELARQNREAAVARWRAAGPRAGRRNASTRG